MTDDVPPDTPSVRPERAKTGRAKPPPRAKLTMDMLLARTTGVDALLASLSTIRFSTARLCPPFLFPLFLPQKAAGFHRASTRQETQRHSGGTSRC